MRKYTFIFVIFLLAGSIYAQASLTDRLTQKMNSTSKTEYIRALVLLKDRVDIEALDAQLYAANTNAQQRAYIVITTLRQKAESTQDPIINYIEQEKVRGNVSEYIPFWIMNMVYVQTTREVLQNLAMRSDVDVMDYDALGTMDQPVSGPILSDVGESVESGLVAIRADSLWRLGITGAGRTVMNIDGGVNGTHNALSSRWWGNNGRQWYHAWLDPIAPATTAPFDCGTHGSHTMGIMCGRGPTDTVGVAPDARWMAAGLTDCPGASYPSMNIYAFQWAMDPDTNASTMNMPDVISCSWQDPSATDECTTSIYRTLMPAVEAAGIAVTFSAGNSGPGASTITKPKNIGLDSVVVFCVGAVDGSNASWPIASFSSRGPSLCGGVGTLLIKPEVSAPGVNVRSSISGNSYGLMSGTSMASPHAAGCIALLKQVAPNMTGKQLKGILFTTCTDLGTVGEDNTYGKGMINVYRAYQMVQTLLGGIQTTGIPQYYSLSQNFPNPFNPTTTIRYAIPQTSAVTIKVYDLLGRVVGTLVNNQSKSPGIYTIDFDASNLSSGVYIYSLEAGNFKDMKKMVVVK